MTDRPTLSAVGEAKVCLHIRDRGRGDVLSGGQPQPGGRLPVPQPHPQGRVLRRPARGLQPQGGGGGRGRRAQPACPRRPSDVGIWSLQGCQVGLFEAKCGKFGLFFKRLASKFGEFIKWLAFFQVQAYLVFGLFPKVYLVKSKMLPFSVTSCWQPYLEGRPAIWWRLFPFLPSC